MLCFSPNQTPLGRGSRVGRLERSESGRNDAALGGVAGARRRRASRHALCHAGNYHVHLCDFFSSFFLQNINNTQSWRPREAAVLAFGCILDGPSSECLASIINQAMSVLLKHMTDQCKQKNSVLLCCFVF
jgi:hypothetical protein